MRKTILTFGLISGAIVSLLMAITVPFADRIGFDKGEIIGYTSIVLSCLMIFFGIRSYRDNVAGGQITFARGFQVGISIALISCVCYVITWEILFYNFLPDFIDKYVAYMGQKMRASGASAAELQAKLLQAQKYKELYKNPFYNVALTLLEPLPVAVVVTLVSAAILRKKAKPQPLQVAQTT